MVSLENFTEFNLESWKDFHATPEKLNSCLKLGKDWMETCEDDLPPCARGPELCNLRWTSVQFFHRRHHHKQLLQPYCCVGWGENRWFLPIMQVLTQESPYWIRFPKGILRHKDEVNRYSTGNYGTSDACRCSVTLLCVVSTVLITCFFGRSHHWHKSDENWADDVDGWKYKVDLAKEWLDGDQNEPHLDRPLPFRMLPSQIRQTEDSQADGKLRMGFERMIVAAYPSGKADVVHQSKDAGREEVAAGKDCLQKKEHEFYKTPDH